MGKATPLVVARMVAAVITITIPLVLARAFSLEDYGTYKQLILIHQTLYQILPFGMTQSLYFFVPRTDQRRPYFVQTLVFLLIAGAVAFLAVGLLGPWIGTTFSNPAIADYRWLLGIYIAALIGSSPLEVSLTSQGKTKASAACYLISDSLRAASMVVPILLGWGLHGLMVCSAAFAVLRLTVTWVVLWAESEGKAWDRVSFGRQFLYAAPFGAAMLLNYPQQAAHQYAVSASVSPEMFALYAVGCFQLPIVDLLYTPTSEVLMVRLGELEKSGHLREGLEAFREAATRLAYVFLPLSSFLFVVAPHFIGGLFGPKYLAAVPIFRITVLGIALAILPMDGVLRARNQTRHIFISYLTKALATVPLVFFGVHYFGMKGGIASWALAEAIGKATLLIKIPLALSGPGNRPGGAAVSYGEVIPWRGIGRALGGSLIAAFTVASLHQLAPQLFVSTFGAGEGRATLFIARLVPLATDAMFFGVIYILGLWIFGVRPPPRLLQLMPSRARGVSQ